MSQERVEIPSEVVRTWFAAFENDTVRFRDTLHEAIEWFPVEENRTRYVGIESAMRYRERWLETWDDHRFDLEEVVGKGGSVVALVHITARGKVSGAEVDLRFYAQFKVRDGKVVFVFDHDNKVEALKAAGLSK